MVFLRHCPSGTALCLEHSPGTQWPRKSPPEILKIATNTGTGEILLLKALAKNIAPMTYHQRNT